MKPIRLITGFLTVGVWTLLSRVLGFLRDIMIAAFLGTGPVAEAFLVAFSLPNLFRRFFAEGAFNMAFVPMFSKKLQAGEDAQRFAQDAFVGLGAVVASLTVLGVIFMPGLVMLMASGFAGTDRFDLAVYYGRIAFPYIFFISLSALLSGLLNATGRFAAAAAAPVLLNVIFVVTLLVAGLRGSAQTSQIGAALAYAVPVAGLAQLFVVWRAAGRAGFALRPRWPKLTSDLRRLAIIAAPAALAGGVMQINLLVGRQVASFFDGAVAWLSYADRLYQLPLGVVGIAIGIVLLPDLSRRLEAGDSQGGRDAFNRASEMSLALTIPASVALIIIPLPLVSVLFERGAFDSDDAANTALAVAIYGAGLPAFVLQKTLQPLYFARADTRRPFLYALLAMVMNAAVAIGLAPVIGFIAAAIGTTVTGWVMVALLLGGTRQMGDAARFDTRFKNRLWRITVAALLMGALLWLSAALMAPFLGAPGLRYGALGLLIGIGLAGYALCAHLLGAFSWAELRTSLRRTG